MSRLKLHILIIVAWFFGFYNVERLITPINLASFIYVLAPAYAILIILLAPLSRISVGWVFVAGLVPYFALKVFFQYPLAGVNLPLTVTEIVSLGVTVFLAHRIGSQLEAVNHKILQLTLGPTSEPASPFNIAQADCYREIRRARNYNRPAAVLSIAPTQESINQSVKRFAVQTERNLIRQYVAARTADILRKELKETDIVAMRNQHFLVLLPETESKHLDRIIQRLQNSAYQKLGIKLMVGTATFPDEAVTFESLVEYSEERMRHPVPRNETENGRPAATADNPVVAQLPENEMNKADIAR